MAEVVLDNVQKVYPGGVTAVRGANLHIADREFVVLVGPSGCGKSTTLRMIAGLEDISGGTISIGGRVVNDVAPKDRDIAMVFQNYALYPHMTVYDNMAFGLKLRGMAAGEIEQRVGNAARILGITELLLRKPKALSGGQRQRVAVGRAIVREPAAFLFDEPLSNLDAKLRVETRVELNKLHHALQTTMIYVTHDQIEAMTLGDRIVIMNDGEIQQVASPMTLYDQPYNAFVGGFIGTPAMNFLDGALQAQDQALVFTGPDEWTLPLPASFHERCAAHAGKKVMLGVRPEHLKPATGEAPGALKATVEVVESLGSEKIVYLRRGEARFVAKLDAHLPLGAGDELALAVKVEACHLFDGASKVNLTCRAPRHQSAEEAARGSEKTAAGADH